MNGYGNKIYRRYTQGYQGAVTTWPSKVYGAWKGYRRYMNSNAPSRLRTLERKVSRLRPEKHVYYSSSTGQETFDTTAILYPLCQPAQGDGEDERQGNVIFLERLALNYKVIMNNAAPAFCRVMLIHSEGLATTIGDILKYPTNALSPKLCHSSIKFRTLYDRQFWVAYESDGPMNDKIYKDLKHTPLRFTGATGSSFTTGQLYLVVLSNSTTNLPGIEWMCNVRWTD